MRGIAILAACGTVALLSGCLFVVNNDPPTVTLSASRLSLRSGERSDLAALATDPDSDPLSYTWYESGVKIADATDSTLAWFAPTVGITTTRTVTVIVKDGSGHSQQDSVTLSVRPAGPGTLRVRNQSPYTVYYLYVSLQTTADWGVDRLGTETISPGAWFNLTGIQSGTYDLRADLTYDSPWWVNYDGTYIGDGETVEWVLK